MTKLCPRGKAAAKRKFAVYPSAYANAYASKICAGKIKDPSGKKRKDFRGPKPAKAMGGRIGYESGTGPDGVKRKYPDGSDIPRQLSKKPIPKEKLMKDPREKFAAEKKAGGGLMAATERLKRQGLRGGGLCKKGMNRKAIGKNS